MENQNSLANNSEIVCHYHYRSKMNIVWHLHNCHIALATTDFPLPFERCECTFFLSFFRSVSLFFLKHRFCCFICRFVCFLFHIIFREWLQKQRLHKLTWTLFFVFWFCYLYAAFFVTVFILICFCFCYIFHRWRVAFFLTPVVRLSVCIWEKCIFFCRLFCFVPMFCDCCIEWMCMNKHHRWYYICFMQNMKKMWHKCNEWSILNAHQFICQQIKWQTCELCADGGDDDDDDVGGLKIEIQQKSSEKFSEVAKV